MARFRKIDPRMWGDAKFQSLGERAKLLWCYLLTGPEVTSLPGIIVAGRLHLAEALGWTPEAFEEAFREAFAKGMAKADWKARVIWLPNAWRYNRPESPNVVRSWRDHWDNTPECELKVEAYQALKAFAEGLGKAFREAFQEALGEGCGQPSPNPEPEPEPEPEREKGGKPPPFPREEIVEAWNAVDGFVHCRDLTDKRKAAIKARCGSAAWLTSWREAIDRVAKSSFCRGENDRGWRADLDWFLRPDSVTKILEGKFDDRSNLPILNGSDESHESPAEYFARMKAEDEEIARRTVAPEKAPTIAEALAKRRGASNA